MCEIDMKHVSQEFHIFFSCEFILHEITCKICVNSCENILHEIHVKFTWISLLLLFSGENVWRISYFACVKMTCRSYFNEKISQPFKFHLIFWCVYSQYEVKGLILMKNG